MESARIAELLRPFAPKLQPAQIDQVRTYIDLLLKWNARTNLTAVRDEESIVTRHFGESLFAASRLLTPDARHSVFDVGSGAGFPGIPLKIWAPEIRVTLIESQNKKATFLKEVIRVLGLQDARVHLGRAEQLSGTADLVTLRAVERFDSVLPVAARLCSPKSGRVGLLVGAGQAEAAKRLLPWFLWSKPAQIPGSNARILLFGTNSGETVS